MKDAHMGSCDSCGSFGRRKGEDSLSSRQYWCMCGVLEWGEPKL